MNFGDGHSVLVTCYIAELMWNDLWHIRFTFCCNNLWKSIVYGCGKSLNNSGNIFLLLCGHPGVRKYDMCGCKLRCVVFSYSSGGTSCEFGDFSVIHCLTGWLPEIIPLQYANASLIAGWMSTVTFYFNWMNEWMNESAMILSALENRLRVGLV